MQKAIVVIGAGSIGERHIRNLWQLGYRNILVFRKRNLPFRDIANAQVTIETNWQSLLEAKPYAAIICTPTSMHLQQAIDCLEAGMHVLVEKPIAHEVFNWQQVYAIAAKNNTLLQVGYMLRFHPLLKKVKNYIANKTFGKVLHIQTYWGEYLPDWHPWEDYKTSYAALKNLGGGVALTYSHDLDVVFWWMENIAKLKKVNNAKAQPSSLEINTESISNVSLTFNNDTTALIHCNLCQKVPQRTYKILLEEAVMDVDYFAATLTIQTKQNKTTETVENFDRNNMFLQQTQNFFQQVLAENKNAITKEQLLTSHQIISICATE
jgi:predicted dehydrogenase